MQPQPYNVLIFSPRWSFGGNRLQIKAETRILSDVSVALGAVSSAGNKAGNPLRSLQPKEQLLQALISNEHMRLTVWLHPLEHGGHHIATGQSLRHYSDVSMLHTSLLDVSNTRFRRLLVHWLQLLGRKTLLSQFT